MKRKILKILTIVFFAGNISSAAFSLSLDDTIAFPVPFNPNKHSYLTIRSSASADSIDVVIYDINGDKVLSRHYSTFASDNIKWNGRNGSGRKVKPGLYIIKITAEDSDGSYGKKIIRILVDY